MVCFSSFFCKALIVLAITIQTVSAASPGIWINEFHYDNSGRDVGEFVEVAATAGFDTNGFVIYLYHGASGSVYVVRPVLPISNVNNGVGFSVIHGGLWNSPSGIALVDGFGTVVQFLSYEGSFTATNGPAAGMTSTDIGTYESADPVGLSLQLAGTGCAAADFSWQSPQAATSGFVNTGQTFNCNDGPTHAGPMDDPTASIKGDPHIETFSGTWFDYQGECDLVLIDAPNFAPLAPLLVLVRTRIRYLYSYIESAVLKIGDDVLEVGSFGEFFVNGVDGGDLAGSGAFVTTVGPYALHYHQTDTRSHKFTISLGKDESIVVKSHKDMVAVVLEKASPRRFHGSRGIVGDYDTRKMLNRQGMEMDIADTNALAREWQVRPEEHGRLFQAFRAPQYPQECKLPVASKRVGRRLGQPRISQEGADN
ncbi:Endonuclease/Exonuclease/phosphatase family [Seminavis robusta]|uniref:Endonuclease/Exonuclease/phosphatase family n=1 Tax=Seminavis robusta TaxID=568900 RepID=A0A9N8DPY2_9STRA|nr:Endonuclease/Exonuclease/phosphatase family [Seminavis robusta]|eukprot:Sro205_g086380.1 Endonuclease/Exonuclease/phosphatase family (424) ;mRNA; r:86565-88089